MQGGPTESEAEEEKDEVILHLRRRILHDGRLLHMYTSIIVEIDLRIAIMEKRRELERLEMEMGEMRETKKRKGPPSEMEDCPSLDAGSSGTPLGRVSSLRGV